MTLDSGGEQVSVTAVIRSCNRPTVAGCVRKIGRLSEEQMRTLTEEYDTRADSRFGTELLVAMSLLLNFDQRERRMVARQLGIVA